MATQWQWWRFFSPWSSGCKVTPAEIRVRQHGGWVTIRRDQVHALKFRNISHLSVRLFDGRRFVLNLFMFPSYKVDRVTRALHESQRANEARRAGGGAAR